MAFAMIPLKPSENCGIIFFHFFRKKEKKGTISLARNVCSSFVSVDYLVFGVDFLIKFFRAFLTLISRVLIFVCGATNSQRRTPHPIASGIFVSNSNGHRPSMVGVQGNKALRCANNLACPLQVCSPHHQAGLQNLPVDGVPNATKEGFDMTYTKQSLATLLALKLDPDTRAVLQGMYDEATDPDALAKFEENLIENLTQEEGGPELARYKLLVLAERMREGGADDPAFDADYRDFRLLCSAADDIKRGLN